MAREACGARSKACVRLESERSVCIICGEVFLSFA